MKRKGFTLIELLVVIAIIGLLATIAAVALNNARTSSRDTKRLADIKQVQTGLELYFNENTSYPFDAGAGLCGGAELTKVNEIDTDCIIVGKTLATYLGGLANISDPQATGTMEGCSTNATSGCDYGYDDGGINGSTYMIDFFLEGAAGGFDAGALHATPAGIAQP